MSCPPKSNGGTGTGGSCGGWTSSSGTSSSISGDFGGSTGPWSICENLAKAGARFGSKDICLSSSETCPFCTGSNFWKRSSTSTKRCSRLTRSSSIEPRATASSFASRRRPDYAHHQPTFFAFKTRRYAHLPCLRRAALLAVEYAYSLDAGVLQLLHEVVPPHHMAVVVRRRRKMEALRYEGSIAVRPAR